MVPKLATVRDGVASCFRAVLFRMVPKLRSYFALVPEGFRAVLFRMVPKQTPK